MVPQMTVLASAVLVALIGSAFLLEQARTDNTGSPDLLTDGRTTAEIYADYFPSPKVDTTNENSPRLQRSLAGDPVFCGVADADSPLHRKLANARKTNQQQRAHRAVADNRRSTTTSPARGVSRRRGGTQTIVELARTRLGNLNRNHLNKSLVSRKRDQQRRQQARKAQSRPQPRTLRRSNVRERLRLNSSNSSK